VASAHPAARSSSVCCWAGINNEVEHGRVAKADGNN
jgi:hypothetical protein